MAHWTRRRTLFSIMLLLFAALRATAFTLSPLQHRRPRIIHRECRCYLVMGMNVKIRIVGRKNGSEKWIEDAYKQYETRLRPSPLDVETVWHKNDQELTKGIQSDMDKNYAIVLMDPKGMSATSEQFSTRLFNWLDRGGSRLAFVIGGAEGLPSELRKGGMEMLSLSALTFTHQFARILLMEQIYRAAEIRKGTGYHK